MYTFDHRIQQISTSASEITVVTKYASTMKEHSIASARLATSQWIPSHAQVTYAQMILTLM